MNIIGKIAITMALLTTTPLLANCQYFQHLFDIDSSYDWGWNIIIKPDGTYFVEGGFVNPATNQWDEYNLIISADGESILNKHLFHFDGVNIYDGNSGEMKELPNGYYIIPLSEQIVHDTFYRGWAGLIKYNNFGDTIFLKTYTDTTTYFDEMIACAIMPDGGYMAGGLRAHDTAGYAYPGLIIRTDSLGDTLWTHTYQKFSNQSVQIFGIVPLSDGRIVVGANSERIKDAGAPHHYPYADFAPWFMILDSAGNIIRDTVYDIGFQGGGWIYKDMNDGYFTFGSYDSLFSDDPTADNNFPSFIAHLDTNFRITWITSFPYSIDNSHREKWLARQLKDSSYIILGDRWSGVPESYGWAAKVNRYGGIVWDNIYYSDLNNDSYFRDVAEKPDGSLVFVGTSFNDTLPRIRRLQDIWLVGVDSNGCENAFCAPTSVKPSPVLLKDEVLIYPNPNNGSFTINISSAENEPVQLIITNIVGQKIKELTATTNKAVEVQMRVPKGMYFVTAITAQGRQSEKVVVE